MVGDRRPLPAEAFPGSPVPPGDRSWDALDRPQPHCLLPQQSQSGFFFFCSSASFFNFMKWPIFRISVSDFIFSGQKRSVH